MAGYLEILNFLSFTKNVGFAFLPVNWDFNRLKKNWSITDYK